MQGTVSLDKSIRHVVTSHRSEVEEHLPRPGRAWRWGDVGLSKSVLQRFAENGNIVRSDAGAQRWETTRKTWVGVRHLLGPDASDTTGSEVGQELIAPDVSEGASRDQGASRSRRPEQLTLTGDAVEDTDEEPDLIARNRRKARGDRPGTPVVRNGPPLHAFTSAEIPGIDAFEISSAARAAVVTPTGAVY
jgi:hypothetical protein